MEQFLLGEGGPARDPDQRIHVDDVEVRRLDVPARVAWTPTGVNVPDYPKLAQLWWQNIGEAVAGEVTVDEAMDNLAAAQDRVMERIERAGVQGECGPKLNEERDDQYWLDQPGAPKPKLANEKPQGVTVAYDDLIEAWRQGKVVPDSIAGK